MRIRSIRQPKKKLREREPTDRGECRGGNVEMEAETAQLPRFREAMPMIWSCVPTQGASGSSGMNEVPDLRLPRNMR
jgi:hypothetical protein